MEATMTHSGDMIDARAYSVDELRQTVFEGRGHLSRPLALGLLARKTYPKKVADLQQILLDEKEQPRLRSIAASGLAETATPAAQGALEKGLKTQDNVTLRAVAKGLGEVGGKKHVKQLQKLAESPGPVGRDAQLALGTLTRRLGLPPPEAAHGFETMPVQATGKPTRITIAAAKAGDVAGAAKALQGRKLARRGAVAMTCQGRRMVFAFDEASLKQGANMFKRGGEVGVVAEPPGVESTVWSARYRVAVEPEEGGAFRILVTTRDGRPVLAGRGVQEGGKATFEVGAADGPGALPVELRGTFDGSKLTFDQARSALRRRPAGTPTVEGDTGPVIL
jgi:hypothetical protein